jgi:chemotaxis protein methyltransferase CheR
MPLSYADFSYVRDMVLRRSAIVLEDAKAYLVDMRLDNLAREESMVDATEIVAKSRTDSRLQVRITEAMTTNETSWFRDSNPFVAFKDVVMPEVIKQRANTRQIFIWCAASSSGQEPYSIAMTLRENFPEVCEQWRVRIMATDLSGPILERARTGVYRHFEVDRGLPKPLLNRYFEAQGQDWAIKPVLRKMVEFKELNLIEPFPAMPSPDIVFIRNVLIYFNANVKRDILSRVHKVMSPNGYLFLGGAETTLGVHAGYSRHAGGGTAFYRPIAGAAEAAMAAF